MQLKKKSIISFDLINNKINKEIENAHDEYITNFRYHLDIINNRDLIISISSFNCHLKLWDADNLTCLFNFNNINNVSLYSACFLKDNRQIYIIISDCRYSNDSESIKIFDLKGIKVKELYNSNEKTFFVESYYDNQLNKNFILTGNFGYIKVYDYNNNTLYNKYCDNDNKEHNSIIIDNKEKALKLIESSMDGNIRIWDFHSGLLLNKIKINNGGLFGISLWNKNYLFIGCKSNIIKLIDINNKKCIKDLNGHNNDVLTIKKFIHPKYGECLISQSYKNDYLKIWGNKN